MIRGCISLLLVTMAGALASTQTVASRAMAEQAIRSLSDEWARVPLKHDTSVLQRIWADDFVYVEPSGRVFTKPQGIADEAKSRDRLTSAEVSDLKIRFYGDAMAVAIGDDIETGRTGDGKPFNRRSRFTNVWVFQNGTWRCVSGHSSDLLAK